LKPIDRGLATLIGIRCGRLSETCQSAPSLVAHSAVCPHWLGPLKEPVVDGSIRCPWHGYVFDLVDGRCQSQPALKLALLPLDVAIADGSYASLLCLFIASEQDYGFAAS